jgi:hypothetical protein
MAVDRLFFFLAIQGGVRRLPFSCSCWLLDNQKKENRWPDEKISKKRGKTDPVGVRRNHGHGELG